MDVTDKLGDKILASEKDLAAMFPGAEQFIDAQLGKIQQTITAALQDALVGFADGLSQILQLGYSITGASVSFEVEPISIPAIRAKFTVSMPLLPKGDKIPA